VEVAVLLDLELSALKIKSCLVAVTVAQEQPRNPVRGLSAIGGWYQRIGEGTAVWNDFV
jgi:hypothetical protein